MSIVKLAILIVATFAALFIVSAVATTQVGLPVALLGGVLFIIGVFFPGWVLG